MGIDLLLHSYNSVCFNDLEINKNNADVSLTLLVRMPWHGLLFTVIRRKVIQNFTVIVEFGL